MGINDFWKIQNNNGSIIKDWHTLITVKDLNKSRIAIDASIIMYQCLFAAKKFDDNAYLKIIKKKIEFFTRHNIIQIWVFDHPSSNIYKCARSKKNQLQLTAEHVIKTMSVLQIMKIQYIVSKKNIEAEHLCVALIPHICDYILTCDTDAFIFGGPHNRIILIKGKGNTFMKYELYDILKQMCVTYDQLVHICVALGTDFNKRISSIGPKTVLNKLLNDDIKFTQNHKIIINMYKKRIRMNKKIFNKQKKEAETTFIREYPKIIQDGNLDIFR